MARLMCFKRNTAGRDIAVGDIHGHYLKLEQALKAIGFDPNVDRLFGTGDLVDRGPQSYLARRFLKYSWFETARGNHDDHVINYNSGTLWANGTGKWFDVMPEEEKALWKQTFSRLPLALQIETEHGLVGIVHADVPNDDWGQVVGTLDSWSLDKAGRNSFKQICMYGRKRYKTNEPILVNGLRALVVGHVPSPEMVVQGNVYRIDTTGGTDNGVFTFLDLNTLEVIKPVGDVDGLTNKKQQ